MNVRTKNIKNAETRMEIGSVTTIMRQVENALDTSIRCANTEGYISGLIDLASLSGKAGQSRDDVSKRAIKALGVVLMLAAYDWIILSDEQGGEIFATLRMIASGADGEKGKETRGDLARMILIRH